MSAFILAERARLAATYGFAPCGAPGDLKVGISKGVLTGEGPLHGVRCLPENTTTGWYIWTGEYSAAPDFFAPLHVAHLSERCPIVLPYPESPPGWRFVVAPGYEDVWCDPDVDVSRGSGSRNGARRASGNRGHVLTRDQRWRKAR